MKTRLPFGCPALRIVLLLSAVLSVQGNSLVHPARFGVVDIMPNEYSADNHQDMEPSLAVGLNVNYGKIAVHTFSWDRNVYTSANTGEPPWTAPWVSVDLDATLDWSAGGNCYLAMLPVAPQVQVRKSLDPTTTDFTTIDTITKGYFAYGHFPDQPWIRTVTVTNVDHIFVGYNDQSVAPPRTATVRWSLDGGSAWNETVIDKMPSPYGSDSPQVRLALSSDGKTAYGLFQRLYGYNGSNPSDQYGDVVLVRDDGYGGTGFTALGTGTLVANNAVIPTGTTLGAQRLAGSCDVVVHPYHTSLVYVAYTEVVNGGLLLRVQSSVNSGATFNLVYSIPNAALPALAVASDGTVGLLYAAKNGTDLEVHFLKAIFGNFVNPNNLKDRVLAKFPDNNPQKLYDPYIGDYFGLRAVGHNFFGTFCASNDPQPSHFPSGVFYQRNVLINGAINNNFELGLQSGTLVDLAGNSVPVSIDPFVFYDIGGSFTPPWPPYISWILSSFYSLGDPFSGIDHLSWPLLPSTEPPLELQTASSLGPDPHWTVPTTSQGVSIIQTNGQNFATFVGPDPQRFFRLQQNLTGSQFLLFAGAGDHGSLVVPPGGGVLGPDGIMTNPALSGVTFIATPTNDYHVDKWYLDGVAVQSNTPSLTVSNITSEHTLVVTFSPFNDLALTLYESSGDEGPTETGNTNAYVVEIENKGVNPLTGVSMMDMLDPMVEFLSASTSQGTVNFIGGQVIANIGTLNPGALATVNIQFLPLFATTILNTANVVCDQPEPDLSNNSASVSTPVIDPVIITNQPTSITVRAGATAMFNVGVTGTPPFTYQWFFNGTNLINNATLATLTLTNVTATQAGDYSVSVLQILGPEEIEGANSIPATLTVQ
jgi:uncharacterized repeat protein (TIGR01451 family)